MSVDMSEFKRMEVVEDDEQNDISDAYADIGNFIIHKKACTCCRRMSNGVSEYTSTVTGETYKIDGYYTCNTSNCIYLVTCGICNVQYVGKTTRSMRERHGDHRAKIKNNICGLGAHFSKHAEEMGIDMNTNMEEIMKHLNLIIITSATEKLKDMEADIMQILKTTEDYGGINIILEKTYEQKQYKCKQCDFRANHKCNISHHKRREYSDFKVLCDCGYMTNVNYNLKRHFKAKHPEYVL